MSTQGQTPIKGKLMSAIPMGTKTTLILEINGEYKQIGIDTEAFKDFMHNEKGIAGDTVEIDTVGKTIRKVTE